MNDQSRQLVRAATGPIILITVGTLFALEKFTPYRFGQTWPVLLIIIGFLRLLGGGHSHQMRKWRNAPPAQAPQPQAARAPNPFPPIPPQGRPGWSPAPPPAPPPPPYRSASEPMPDMTPPPPPRPGERR
jgi:Domain of unknown function (DUF5668)